MGWFSPDTRLRDFPDRRVRTAAGVVRVRAPRRTDGQVWAEVTQRDEHYLRPWEAWAGEDWAREHSQRYWPVVLRHLRTMQRLGTAVAGVIEVDGVLAGQVTVGGINRGVLQSGWVGYWVRSDLAGRGVASVALAIAVDHAFGGLALHRLEASVQPPNLASRAVLAHNGFREVGLIRRALFVDGQWRDHVLVEQVIDDFSETALRRLERAGRASVL